MDKNRKKLLTELGVIWSPRRVKKITTEIRVKFLLFYYRVNID